MSTSTAQLEPQSPRVEWLTTAEAAAYLKISPRAITARATDGRIKSYSMPHNERHIRRYKIEDLNRSLTDGN